MRCQLGHHCVQALESCHLLFNVLPVCLCGTGKHHWALTFILGSGALHSNRVRSCNYFCEVDLYQERKDSFIAYEDRLSIHMPSFIFHDPMGPHPVTHFFFPLSLTWGSGSWGCGRNLLNIYCVLGTK